MKHKTKEIEQVEKNLKIEIIKLITFIGVIAIIIGLVIYLFPNLTLLFKPDGQQEFKQKIDELGILGGFVLFGLQLAQISLVVLPGEPIEIMAGMCYGTIGGTLFITASVFIITTMIVFLVKKYGKKYIYNFFKKEKIDKIENSKFFKNPKTIELIMIILFLIPGTPKDLLVYLGGILPIKPWRFILISTFARFPSVISSTIAGANVMYGNWKVSVLTYAITFLLTFIFIFLVNKFDKNNITKDAINVVK